MSARVGDEKVAFARSLRRETTVAETMLWRSLRARKLDGLKFRRQVPIGRYVADFLCAEDRFIAELDGAPHENKERHEHDATRDAWLRAHGYRVLRLSNDIAIGGGDIALDLIRAAMLNDAG
jgi:very-short-patch-repair endonuclease